MIRPYRRRCTFARLCVAAALVATSGACSGSAGKDTARDTQAPPPIPVGSAPLGAAAHAAALEPPGPPVTPELLETGRRAWLGKCAPCHGADLRGDGPVVRQGFPRPAPLDPRALDATDVVVVVTQGRGTMPSLAVQVPPHERWAIARWLEAR